MNYHNITKDDMLNGTGLRVVLWVSGCAHACPDCQNPQTWEQMSGIPFDKEAMDEIRAELQKDYIDGITLSGGDPLFPGNRRAVTRLLQTIRAEFPDKTIWLYTGYSYEQVCTLPAVELADVIVDGEYLEAKRDVNAPWVGSANQRVIDIKKTATSGKITLWEDKHCI